MRTSHWFASLALLFVAGGHYLSAQFLHKQLFLLEDIRGERWCAYPDESRWAESVASLGAKHLAELEFVNDIAQTVIIELSADSGDWAVEDTYSLDTSGDPRRLRRRLIQNSGGFIEESIYVIEDHRARLERQETKSIYSGLVMKSQRTSPQSYYFPDVAIAVRMKDVPFHQFIAGEIPEVWDQNSTCVKLASAQ